MNQTIQTLMDEHGNIRRMLSCFEAQIELVAKIEPTDYEILEGSIAYCHEFLDNWHHAREDILFEMLQRRAPEEAHVVMDIDGQHRHLALTTNKMVKLLEAVQNDMVYPRAPLVKMGRELVHSYRKHLLWEEENFFPVVTENLLAEDWEEIEARFAGAKDPLAANPIDQRYRKLFLAIGETSDSEPASPGA